MKTIILWANRKGLLQGIFWTICASFFSNLCDTSIRLVGNNLPSMEVAFFRLFFGTLVLLPLVLLKGRSAFLIQNKLWHLIRIIVGFGAVSCWVYGASQTTLPSITTISFVCPILVLPLAYIFLKEKLDWKRVLSVCVGFCGVFVIAFFEKGITNTKTSSLLYFHSGVIFLFLAAILFAISDILNKKMVSSESLFSLLFYFYLGSAIISFIPALLVWQPVEYREIFYLLILGIGGVSILFCILKAANAADISSIAPYKYVELIFSIVIGYLLFKEIIRVPVIVGAGLIITSALLIAYYELNKEKSLLKETATETTLVGK